jgi:hypothetical protein
MVIALSETDTLWQVAVGMGAVVVLVVIALLTLLLRFVADIEAGAQAIVTRADEVAANTVALDELAKTSDVLGDIREEALIHLDFLSKA